MFINRTMAALIVIGMASSLIIMNGLVASASAANNNSKKVLNTLSKCQLASATDGDLTLAETKDCYNHALSQGQHNPKGPNTAQDVDRLENGHEQQETRSSSLDDPKIGSMREGFNF
jgi:hypothetical protein